jgi:uncharacterized protein (UPF0335 family)
MARPKGSKNKPKAAKPAAATPGVGHNELTDEQKTALLLQGVVKIERMRAEMASINADIRNVRKTLKADGFTKAEVDYAIFLRASKPEDATEQVRMQIRLAQWLAHPMGMQADLFGDGVDRTPSVERAYAEGKVAGMAGEACVLPSKWAPGSEQAEAWVRGWHEGQAVLASGIKPIAESDDEPDAGEADRETDEEFDDATSGKPSIRNREFAEGGLGDAPQRTAIN